jgi:hypothetical protein
VVNIDNGFGAGYAAHLIKSAPRDAARRGGSPAEQARRS